MTATIDTFARAIVAAFATGIVTSAVLAVFVAMAVCVLRPSATTQHALWWIVLAATVALPVAGATASFGRIEHRIAAPVLGAARIARVDSDTQSAPARLSQTTRLLEPEKTRDTGAPRNDWSVGFANAFASILRLRGLATLLAIVWIVVAALRLVALGYGFIALMRLKAEARTLDENTARRLRRFRHSSRMGRRAALLVSDAIDVPIAVGFGRAAILLPAGVVAREAVADLDQIVMHEHAHLNRYDDVTNLLQVALEGLFWFNPVVALAGRRISLQREIACDDSVIAQTGRAHRYATCLWRLVESARMPTSSVMAPGAFFTPKQLTTRIEQLLDSKRNALPRLSPLSAFALASLCALLIVAQAMRAPVIALEDPQPAAVAPAAPLAVQPLAVPSPAPPAHRASERYDDARHRTEVRIASGATPEAIANAVIDATMKRSLEEARLASNGGSSELARAAAALGTGVGLDIARQLSEKLAPVSARPAIDRSISEAKQRARREVADAEFIAAAASGAGGNHRHFGSFRTVRVGGSFDVEIRRGASAAVDFGNDTYLAEHTRTEVDDGTLTIDQTSGTYASGTRAKILVYAPVLDAVEIDGSANVDVVDVRSSRFSARISGSGDLEASGTANATDVTIEGSGNADFGTFATTSMDVRSEGSGNVAIVAPARLSVRLEGSGNITMRGTPKQLFSRIDGSGSIVKL